MIKGVVAYLVVVGILMWNIFFNIQPTDYQPECKVASQSDDVPKCEPYDISAPGFTM